MKERFQDDEWVGIYLDLTEQQYWLDPVEGIRHILPFMIAASIYHRDINADTSAIGQFFEQQVRRPYRDWWTWANRSLAYMTSRNPSPEELNGLEELANLAKEHCPTFPLLLPDCRKELEAALWWRLGESHRGRDENKAVEWFERALSRLNKEIELREATAEVYYEIAIGLLEERKYTESIRFLNRAIELKPDYNRVYFARGIAYGNLKEYQRAIADYERAIELDPSYVAGYLGLALAYLWLRNVPQARVNYIRSYELDSTDVKAAWMAEWVGMSKLRPGIEEAMRLEAIAAIEPKNHVAYVCRGVALGLEGKVKEGLKEVEKAIPLAPQEWDAYFWKGMLLAYYRRLPHADEVMSMIEQSLQTGLPPQLLTPLYWLEKDLPDLFVKYARPLLLRYVV